MRTLIWVIPPANASCLFIYPFVGPSCIYAIRPVCVHHGTMHYGVRIGCLIAIHRQNAICMRIYQWNLRGGITLKVHWYILMHIAFCL